MKFIPSSDIIRLSNFKSQSSPSISDIFLFISSYLGRGQPLYLALFAAMIIFFGFFYTGIVFNPDEQAENLRKYGGFIPGIRPGEKLHEQMIGPEDALYTYEYPGHFKILPSINNWSNDPERIGKGVRVDPEFLYSSNNNKEWMEISELKEWIEKNRNKIGNI